MKKPLLDFNRTLAVPVLLLLSLSAALAGELESRSEPERRASLGSGERAEPSGRAMPVAPAAGTIQWSDLGTQAGAQYQGDGLSITATEDGARLRCVFQKLEGQATPEGLWLISTDAAQRVAGSLPATDGHDRFRVMAKAFGRENLVRELPAKGSVDAHATLAQFTRPGLVEEYSVSADGVRQDFVIAQPPPGDGRLLLELEVTGAQAEQTPQGARLVLPAGRRIAYSRLYVTDATGRKLPARIEVGSASLLRVSVDDEQAAYPVRIDPTFSDDNWISMGVFPGVNGVVNAIVADDAGNFYIGGEFTMVGGVAANRVAKWDGLQWSALGVGMNWTVNALCLNGGKLYAGGRFTQAGGQAILYLAVWNGSSWAAPGGSFGFYQDVGGNTYVNAIAVLGNDLYVGGKFYSVGPTPANNVARLYLQQGIWSGLWNGASVGVDGEVTSFATSGTNLFVGGFFANVSGGFLSRSVARWDGNSWAEIEALSTITPVLALAVVGSDLFAAGLFTSAGGNPAHGVAKWDGTSWSALGEGLAHLGFLAHVHALAVSDGHLYAGGLFTTAGGVPASGVARWDGSEWSPAGEGVSLDYGSVRAIAVSGPSVVVGGDFLAAAGKPAGGIALWDGATWGRLQPGTLKPGIQGEVNAVLGYDSNLYVGGFIHTAGETRANGIARWDGMNWSGLGVGLAGSVRALAASGSDLFVAGDFYSAGDAPAAGFARWDGNEWSALGNGVPSMVVNAMALYQNDLVAAGKSLSDGRYDPAVRIARWNGQTWSQLGAGLGAYLSDEVLSLAVFGNDLFAGGNFSNASNSLLNYLVRWNGTAWVSAGGTANGAVRAMSGWQNKLVIGGSFTKISNVPMNYLAVYNGFTWVPLADGLNLNGSVSCLQSIGADLYVGGLFTTAGNVEVAGIARWDGSSWHAVGSGLLRKSQFEDLVVAMGTLDLNLFVSGGFNVAGNKSASGIALWSPYPKWERTLDLNFQSMPGIASVSWPTSSVPFQLESAPAVGHAPGAWEPVTTPPVVENGTNRVTVPDAGSQFFRLKYP